MLGRDLQMPGAGKPPRRTFRIGDKEVALLGPEHYRLKEYFAPGLYVREIFMPAGHMIVGEVHKTEHLNTIIRGRVRVVMDGEEQTLEAPCTFVSKAGVSKRLLIEADCIWQTYHPNPSNERNLQKLREILIEESGIADELTRGLEHITQPTLGS